MSLSTLPVCAVALLLLAAAPAHDPAADRVAAAQATYEAASGRYQAGATTLEEAAQWSLRWAEASAPKGWPAHLDRMKKLEEAALARYQSGTASRFDVTAAAYWRADAELRATAK